MASVFDTQSAYWTEHFSKLARTDACSNQQLDFNNQALVVQNYAFVLEACGTVLEKRVLDVGFGTGDLARTLELLGGKITAIDVVPDRVPRLREAAPNVAWWCEDLNEWELPARDEPYDLIVACESMQYVDFDGVLPALLSALDESGRLVILIPNSDCPIVQRTSERFDHKYVGISMQDLPERLLALTGDWFVAYRGIYFQNDQTLVPYRTGPWIRLGSESNVPPPRMRGHRSGISQMVNADRATRMNQTSHANVVANRVQIVIKRNDGQDAQW